LKIYKKVKNGELEGWVQERVIEEVNMIKVYHMCIPKYHNETPHIDLYKIILKTHTDS
jgi:hypothetical protein